ncbi:hypothetical protein [Helicobacter cappadocius]|uniref:Sugar transferase n=1 Tax=Helicobacter cappadocius TaxID=3063998 RepID=A0AA90PUK8_9HELI|nr:MULTISPECIES: hypothetical protein [unclassified Helicobacter]MDO7253863.1 hypothetical protein [Helicobacter sp. faydin-H75]MDP2539819.1 hypothetical protein [Helicobacter sp. faydin-H76]
MLAPVVLFVYNRPIHTKQVIEALIQNTLAKDTELFIFSDHYKTKADEQSVLECRKYIQSISSCYLGGFKKVHIICRDRNFGLADSIIDGVSTIINKYGKAIILEDDIVVSNVFLDYMNSALDKYEMQEKIWAISAWNYPIASDDLGDCFFWRIPHCWGWATWKNRWQYYKRDIDWVKKNFDSKDIKAINLGTYSSYWNDFVLNEQGKIKTWAIFNYLIAYKHNALTLMPSVSYIRQIGFDGSGTHCGDEEIFHFETINTKFPIEFPNNIEESPLALLRIQNFHRSLKKPFFTRAKNKLLRIFKKIFQSNKS